ncbi:MAG: SEC-C domain-containing protein [Gammaproteobacteria bacterium]|nr:SEC-C domain-containing protein [Gammaproteobacteria bacterium]
MNEESLPYDAFFSLVEGAVERIIDTDDFEDFLGWFTGWVDRQFFLAGVALDDREGKAFAAHLGRAVWSATPAPHNGFNPQPLPKPGRNQPCFCGSGAKYKRCCGRLSQMPVLHPAELWPTVLDLLPVRSCRQVVASGRVPVESLIFAAEESRASGRSSRAIGLLEPLFGAKVAGTEQSHEQALSLLCDLYDDAGWTRKKTSLLDSIAAEAPRSPLRAGAFQRMALIRLDRGDRPGAWGYFRRAQRDAPYDPALGLLEVHILLYENRPEDARERARFWRRRMIKRNAEEFEGVIGFFGAVADDPYRALAKTLIDAADGAGRRLFEALSGLDGRPLPRYQVVDGPGSDTESDAEAELAGQLRGMGMPLKNIRAMVTELIGRARNLEPDEDGEDETLGARFRLAPPERLRSLESDWHTVYPPGKPFSIDDVPREAAYPWDPEIEDAWTGFLNRHPEAFDSIDVLDDLITAMELHPMSDSRFLREALQAPLLDRGVRILRQAIAETGPGDGLRLPWEDARNRPGLRCIARAHQLAMARDDAERTRSCGELLLALNPNDNHGVRTSLMNLYLRTGENEAALALASRYENDMFAELRYGLVLALFRTGRKSAASAAARRAVEDLPEVRRYLMRERARQPRIDPHGFALGSKEQAWLYRDEMREVWVEEPEALALIRRTRPSSGARSK